MFGFIRHPVGGDGVGICQLLSVQRFQTLSGGGFEYNPADKAVQRAARVVVGGGAEADSASRNGWFQKGVVARYRSGERS